MDKKLSDALTLTPEWTRAHTAIREDSQRISIELRQFRMPDGEPISRAYKQLNGDILADLSSGVRSALLELAKGLGRSTNNSWTFAVTRLEEAVGDVAGLSLDHNRIQVLGLASKRGVQTLVKKICDSYGSDPQVSRLCGFTGLSWGKPQQPFLLVTIPREGRENLERVVERARFTLSKAVPRDAIIDKQKHSTRFAEYPTQLFDENNLFYLAYVGQEVIYAKSVSAGESRKFES